MPTGIYKHKMGRFCSKETRAKMSAIHKGKIISEKQRKEHSNFMKKNKIKPPSWLGRNHTLETKIKMSERFSGKKSHFWEGGISKEHKRIRETLKYRLWREAVFKRDNHICVIGGKKHKNRKLNADHIKPFAKFPELRFDINNGRTLCIVCYKKTDTYGKNRYAKK